MEPHRPIFWGQGMFLQPQHFQQQDCYHEARLRRYMHLLQPFCWGVRSLSINETALRNFMLEVERCELVTLEGTIVRFQSGSLPSNTRIVPRSCEAALASGDRPRGVYLGLKRLQWEENNLDTGDEPLSRRADTKPPRRFSVEAEDTSDLFAEDGQGSTLKYLVHEVRILFEDEAVQAQDYELIKIADLLHAAEGR